LVVSSTGNLFFLPDGLLQFSAVTGIVTMLRNVVKSDALSDIEREPVHFAVSAEHQKCREKRQVFAASRFVRHKGCTPLLSLLVLHGTLKTAWVVCSAITPDVYASRGSRVRYRCEVLYFVFLLVSRMVSALCKLTTVSIYVNLSR